MKMGSLFDGSGGFPLAAAMCGITPVFASEIEPYPIAVTTSRFPNVRHYGDVSKINGAEVEPVDVLTFGSPCQDLSVAGKRAGLKHEDNGDEETTRSGLFMEAVRIIKEMREATNGILPRFAVWENVPGAFSSNGGEDFRIVLEELIKIAEPNASVPPMPKGGWPYADCYVGDGWSLAYRTLDAQYWGVPQRRRRIYLVADFGGERAGEILFKREGLRGYFTQGRTPWQGTATDAQRGVGTTDCERNCVAYTFEPSIAAREGGHIYEGVSGTLRANAGDNQMSVAHMVLDDQGGQQINVRTDGKAPTLRAETHGNVPCVMESGGFCPEQSAKTRGIGWEEEKSPTLRAGVVPAVVYDAIGNGEGNIVPTLTGDHENRVTDYTAIVAEPTICIEGNGSRPSHQGNGYRESGQMYTLNTTEVHAVCYPIHDQATRCSGKRGDKQDGKGNGLGIGNDGDPMNTITSGDRHAVCYTLSHGTFMIDPNDSGIAATLQATDHKDPQVVVYTCASKQQSLAVSEDMANTLGANDYKEPQVVAFDRAAFNQGQNALYSPQFYTDGTAPTLVAKGPSGVCTWDGGQTVGTLTANNAGGNQRMPDKDNFNAVIERRNTRYIVRRLTPTECARLQGFPDFYGHPTPKETLTDEEYRFWLDVRNTHAAINGKQVKDYSKEQIITWYNKLHTDSSEYKMWGNGIALPNALYVMQGIAEVLA